MSNNIESIKCIVSSDLGTLPSVIKSIALLHLSLQYFCTIFAQKSYQIYCIL